MHRGSRGYDSKGPDGGCFICGGPHLQRDCPEGRGGPDGGCYQCGGPHLARECPQGKGGGKAFERNGTGWGKYRRNFQPPAPDNGSTSSYDAPRDDKRASLSDGKGSGRSNVEPPARNSSSEDAQVVAAISKMEARLAGVQKEFMQALHQKSKKENETFEMIFGILSELQQRHAQLEDTVQQLSTQHLGAPMMNVGMGGAAHGQMFSNGGSMPQHYGQMTEMNGNMGMQQPAMQQYGMVNPDGSQTMMTMPHMQQVIVVSSPSSNAMTQNMNMQTGMNQGGHTMGTFTQVPQPSSSDFMAPTPPAQEEVQASASSTAVPDSKEEGSVEMAEESSQLSRTTPQGSSSSTRDKENLRIWDKDRTWRVVGLEDDELVPLVSQEAPYGPGIGRDAPDDIVLRWLKNGDCVKQMGHSKKIKHYMVMPVSVLAGDSGEEEEEVHGYVTRRSVDKSRDNDIIWFEEVEAEREEKRERLKPSRGARVIK